MKPIYTSENGGILSFIGWNATVYIEGVIITVSVAEHFVTKFFGF